MSFYDAVARVWNQDRDYSQGAIGKEVWDAIATHIKPNSKTLEFGCGLSTLLFNYAGHHHTAIDNNQKWIDLVKSHELTVRTQIVHSAINSLGFYLNVPPGPYDCVLIDGPAGEGKRSGVIEIIESLVKEGAVIIVDDTNRPKERALSEAIQNLLCASQVIEGDTSHGRKFDLIIV